MTPEDEFEAALQKYEIAVAEYKIAQDRYALQVGMLQSTPVLDAAINRICRIVSPPGTLQYDE